VKPLQVVVIGAGIVGLATAYQLLKARPHLSVLVLEKEAEPAQHQTGNNSGVIHSGIYYKPGSLKAKNCLAGKEELLAFCEEFGIPTQKLGKVIVTTAPHQRERLDEIESRGRANGVPLERIGPARLKEIEPHVQALEALWIPDCSIISYRAVAARLAAEVVRLGGEIRFGEAVQAIHPGIVVETSQTAHRASHLINCAGLFSDRIARKALGAQLIPHRILPFRGEYYELAAAKHHLVNGLIYPVPDPRFPFLGVHLTRMVNGHVEAGPNAILALSREGYRKTDIKLRDCLDTLAYPGFWKMAAKYWQAGCYELARSFSKKLFLRDLQKLVPAIEEKDLQPGGAGIRAQVVARDGKLIDDFAILEEKNMVHVLNAPSPAATASFAIGRHIASRILGQM
jgi:L-2-hydroxyglutarate oxidase LhgO